MIGTVKETGLRLDRSFGFISTAVGDVFFHASDLDPSLPFDETLAGRRVDFEIVDNPKGPRAANVKAAAEQVFGIGESEVAAWKQATSNKGN